ncbi:hypothetical protein DPMN_170466 [Dreissena polymorpha]|uniref:Uncharacterized protein n=1 Tax=Dreissena polymorpha TaxID=45954 RepID=A0A9D4DZU7_DREPO|nr:hypothetical protein DPMN_170466 [Dreissena polymorpha]
MFRKIYDDKAKNVTSRVENDTTTLAAVFFFSPIQTIFELNRLIQKTHVRIKFHEDWTKNVTSRVFTCFHFIEKTAPPPGGHATIVTSRVFTGNTTPPPGGHLHEDKASNVTSTVFTCFELSRGINGTNVLTKFHEDRTINVASRVFTRQNVDDARPKTDKRRSQKLAMSTLCSAIQTNNTTGMP